MGMNKIGSSAALLPQLSVALAQGTTFMIPVGQGPLGTFNGAPASAVGWSLSGQYNVNLGTSCELQALDSGSRQWKRIGVGPAEAAFVSADGTNLRIANTTGTPTSATITNAGSGYTNGYNTLTVTPSTGGSTWNTIVGGSINTAIAITSGGANYTAVPVIVFDPPANQGSAPYVLPTATCTLSGGAINAVTVVNAGAGLVSKPTIRVIPQDSTGGGAVLTVNDTLTGSGTLTALFPATYGTSLATAPTLSFNPASTTAATAVLNGATGIVDTVSLQAI